MYKQFRRLFAVKPLYALARRLPGMVVALAFLLNGLGYAPPVRADDIWTYKVDVVNPKLILCTNQSVTYRIQILATGSTRPNEPPETDVAIIEPRTSVTAEVADASLGTFTTQGTFSPLPGPGFTAPTTATHVFKTKNKLGTTTLTFGAFSDSFEAVPFPITIKVVQCSYKVLVVSRFAAAYPGGSIEILAATNAGDLKLLDDGSYAGEANVAWIATAVINQCSYSNLLAVSKVRMRGYLNEDGKLAVNLQWDKTPYVETIPCIPGIGGERSTAYATPLDVTVPAATGGTVITNQKAMGGAGADGKATVYILRPDGT
jgi:hypothetical protein